MNRMKSREDAVKIESPATSVSPWVASKSDFHFPRLSPIVENLHADVGIVGAGIAGLTTAYLLALEGKSVVILEDGMEPGTIGVGETSRTTAHLTCVFDESFETLEKWHGEEGARLAVESHRDAIDIIESIIKNEKIDCDFERVDAFLFSEPTTDRQPSDFMEREYAAALRLGVKTIQLSEVPAGFTTGPCLKFPDQAQFSPLKYLHGLSLAFLKSGGRIFRAHVEKVEGGTPAFIHTREGFTTTVGAVVVATNTPVNDRFVMHTKQAAYRTYAIGIHAPKNAIPRALYWDTEDPYHYIRLQAYSPTHDLFILGGEDHKTGQPPTGVDPYLKLETWARSRFPFLDPSVAFRWSGQVMEPIDGLAFIGHNPWDESNIYIATGDAGQGMTHGTIAGKLISDLIWGRENPWEKVYKPSRKTLGAAWRFTQENTNVIIQYTDWFRGKHPASTVEEIPQASGGVIEHCLKKTAVYRDSKGNLTYLSAVCPHLGGIVTWNAREKTWDCPCHGSRFDAYGKVMNGPAIGDLAILPEFKNTIPREKSG